MELMREVEGMNPSIIDPKRLIEKLRSYLPAEREMIEEAYRKGMDENSDYISVPHAPIPNAERYFEQTFKSISDEK